MFGAHVATDDQPSRRFRRALVETLMHDGHLRSPRVAAALLDVPRELFVPGLPLEEVYRPSDAIVTKRIAGVSVSSASAPEVVALMLEQLEAQPGDRVLEIGAGTGYNAALLAHIVGRRGYVVTVDIDEDLVLGAREHLRQAGYGHVKVVQSDGALGAPDQRQFDRTILTVASNDIAPAWRDQLARAHGRLVMPLGLRGLQRCVVFLSAQDHLVSRSLRNCSFISLRGLLGCASARLALDDDGGCVLSGGGEDEPLPIPAARLGPLLKACRRVWRTGVTTSVNDIRDGLHLWLAMHQPNVYSLWGDQRIPDLFGVADRMGTRGTLCAMDGECESLALLAWRDATAFGGELCLLTSPGAEGLGHVVQAAVRDWDAAGRPMDAQASVRAYPRGQGTGPAPDEIAIDQRWTRFLVRWAQPPAILTV